VTALVPKLLVPKGPLVIKPPAAPPYLLDFLGQKYFPGDLVSFPSIGKGRILKKMVVAKVLEIRGGTKDGKYYTNAIKEPLEAAIVVEPLAANWGFKYKVERVLIRNLTGVLKLPSDFPLEGINNEA